MAAHFEEVASDAGHRLRVRGGNGEIVLSGEVLEDEASVDDAALAVVQASLEYLGRVVQGVIDQDEEFPDALIQLVDERTPPPVAPPIDQ